MKKYLLLLTACMSLSAYALQLSDSISIGPSDNVANLVMSARDYATWINNDGFQRSNLPFTITSKLYQYFKDDFDVIMLISNEDTLPSTIPYYGINSTISNNVQGIGLPIYNMASAYGSAGRLFSLMHLPYVDAIKYGPTLHEFCHCWANFCIPTAVSGHWGFCGGNSKGQLGGFKQSTLISNVDGIPNKYSVETFGVNANGGNGVPYNELELYLMGMLPIDSVHEFDAFPVVPPASYQYYGNDQSRVCFTSDTRIHYTQATIIDSLGARVPNYYNSPKSFRALFVVLSRQPLTTDEWAKCKAGISWFCQTSDDGISWLYNFWEATRGVGSIDPSNLSASLKNPSDLNQLNQGEEIEIYTLPATIVCPVTFRIFSITGQEVTNQNGFLPSGMYIVQTTKAARKVWVK